MRPVTIIIPVFNCVEYTEKCLESIKECGISNVTCIVVNNGSTDNTKKFLSDYAKNNTWVRVLTNPENKGFVGGVNAGLRAINDGDDIIILNNDTEFTMHGFVKLLQDAVYGIEKCGIGVPRQMDGDGKLLIAYSYTLPVSLRGWSEGNQLDVRQLRETRKTEVAMFACAYIRREVFDAVGLLDANIVSYAEDSDYSMRARMAGWDIYYFGGLELTHYNNITTTENNIDREKLHDESLQYYRMKWGVQHAIANDTSVDWQGVSGYATGYSKMTDNLMRGLTRANVQVQYIPAYQIPGREPFSSVMVANDLRQRGGVCGGVQVTATQGDVFFRNSGRYRIGYTMMDCDRYPAEWVRQMNMMHEIWTPTKKGVEIAKSSGVEVPVFRDMPLGVNPDYFDPKIEPLTKHRHIPYLRERNFVSVFEWGERKRPAVLIDAWYRAFHDNPDVALFIKFTNSDPRQDPREIVAQTKNKYPQAKTGVFYLTSPEFNGFVLDEYLMGSFYRCFDGFVLASAGEGFGLPELEALACGLPVAITGQFSFLSENRAEFGDAVSCFDFDWYDIKPTDCFCDYYHGARWAEPKMDSVVETLRRLYNKNDDLKVSAGKAAEIVRRNCSWDQAALRVKAAITEAWSTLT